MHGQRFQLLMPVRDIDRVGEGGYCSSLNHCYITSKTGLQVGQFLIASGFVYYARIPFMLLAHRFGMPLELRWWNISGPM